MEVNFNQGETPASSNKPHEVKDGGVNVFGLNNVHFVDFKDDFLSLIDRIFFPGLPRHFPLRKKVKISRSSTHIG